MSNPINTGICRSCKELIMLKDNVVVEHHKETGVICGGSFIPPIDKPFPKGYCKYCNNMVILIQKYLRKHKNRAGGICKGSDRLATERPGDREARDREYLRITIPLLKEIEKMPIDEFVVLQLKKLFDANNVIADTPEFIRIITGPLGEFIRNEWKGDTDE